MVKKHEYVRSHPDPQVNSRLARLSGRHYGYAQRTQLLEAGLSRTTIQSWTRSGRLYRRHQGVYSIGPPRTEPIALAAAAVLAGGTGAVLSHGSAAALWGLSRRWPDPPEVTTPKDRRAGAIRRHRTTTLAARDVRTQLGIRVTSAARTLLDLAPHLTTEELERMASTARIERRCSADEIDALTARLKTHPGATRLREAVLGHAGPTRSQLERRFLALLQRHGLPKPLVNTDVAGHEVDILFAPERLIIEIDGWEYHRDKLRFRRDRRRDAATLQAGYETLRLTDDQLERRNWPATAALIERHLDRRRRDLGLPDCSSSGARRPPGLAAGVGRPSAPDRNARGRHVADRHGADVPPADRP